jgi:energy-coupling factor transporter ATP-binding protein EcfA2
MNNFLTRTESQPEGLLIGPASFSYLKRFVAPLFDSDDFEFIRLDPGLNLIFGRNGSGKTSLLRIMESTLAGRTSPFEGLVVKLSSRVVQAQIERYQIAAEVFAGDVPKQNENLQYAKKVEDLVVRDSDRWSYENFEPVIAEWVRNPLAVITSNFDSSIFGVELESLPINLGPKGLHELKFETQKHHIDQEIVPLIFVNEDTPKSLESIKELRSVFKLLRESSEEDGRSQIDIPYDQEKLDIISKSPLANRRNFLTSKFDDNWHSRSQSYFLEPLPVLKSYSNPQVSRLESEKDRNARTYISFVSDGYPISNECAKLPDLSEIAKMTLNKAIQNHQRERIVDDASGMEQSRQIKMIADDQYVIPACRDLNPTFRKFGHIRMFSPTFHGLLWGSDPQFAGIPQASLSYSEDRWLRLSLLRHVSKPSAILIDEPERGLDPNSLREISKVISQNWAKENLFVATTHSPSLLSLPNANVIMIKNQRMIPYSRELLENLNDWGISPVDLLVLIRAFVFVEGEHEKIVLEHYFGDALSKHGIKIIPVRGTSKMTHLAEWSLFFETTDCPIVAVMDNLDPELVLSIYNRAREIYQTDGWDEANTFVRKSLVSDENQGGEASSMAKLISEAIKIADQRRFFPTSLEKKDILFYLDKSIFDIPDDWELLYTEFSKERIIQEKQGVKNKLDFKSWVSKRFKLNGFSSKSLNGYLSNPLKDFPPHPELVVFINKLTSEIAGN